VQAAGEQSLPGPGLAVEEDRRQALAIDPAGDESLDLFAKAEQRGTVADQLAQGLHRGRILHRPAQIHRSIGGQTSPPVDHWVNLINI
jgi:hypothetical protein